MVNQDKNTRSQEERIGQLHKRESFHVAQIDNMGDDRQDCSKEWEPIHQPQNQLNPNDAIYKTRQEALRGDAMLLDELRQVIETRRDSESQKAETQKGSHVADKR